MTGNAPTFATLFLRIFLPFALAYFLSYIFRGVNAVIFPYLERDVGITAADLGLLTSAFFWQPAKNRKKAEVSSPRSPAVMPMSRSR